MLTRILVLAAAIAAGASAIWAYRVHSDHHPSTEDAYVGADVVQVAPQVSGRLAEVPLTNQQRVHRGEILFTIDPQPFRFAVRQAEAGLELARRQVTQAQAAVSSAEAEAHHQQVLLENARAKVERARRLVKQDYMSRQSVDDAEAEYKSAEANLGIANAGLEEAQRQLGKPGEKNDRVIMATATLDHARWELDNTRVTAACDGQVDQLDLRPGSVVRADTPVFALICTDHYWVDANYKETQLTHVRPGQVAEVMVDMYPGHRFRGVVESISGATGSAFSLLPPENASGNWVKVTQRIPVRIHVVAEPAFPLRVGASSTVTVDTTRSSERHATTAS
jgi:membrane fusion protein (multidrug efflux system)